MSNPLKQLINCFLSENHLSKSELLEKLGYSNINKGAKKLNAFINNPDDGNELFKKIITVTDISEDALLAAIQQVKLSLDKENQRKFKPSLHVIPSGRPSPIFAAAILQLEIPDNLHELSLSDEITTVSNLFQKYQKKINNPSAWAHAKGFYYRKTYEKTLNFDSEGNLITDVTHLK